MLVQLNDLKRALESEEIVPCFQPIVDIRTGQVSGFEVLARWRHPEFGLILPENFISLAEENGLIGELTHQILSQSFLSAAPLLPEPLFLAINISPIQLRYQSLPRQIREAAVEAGFPLQRLTVEITESALVNNLERARRISVELKEMGCKLALDDFGTGFSSLRHLQALPFSKLKIDGSFVQSMTRERESRKIVAAVVGLGRSLGMVTVAEGVETQEQAELLLWLGCELAQGWFYGRPLLAECIPDMIAAARRTVSGGVTSVESEGEILSLEALPGERLAQLQAIYNGAPVGLCFLDRNLRYVSINRRLADMNGASMAGHIGRHVREMIPALFPKAEPYLLRALKGEAIASVEFSKPPRKPGMPNLTVLASYQPAFDEAKEVIGVSVAIVDITERILAERALHENREDYRHLFELGPHLQWILDSDGNVLDISSHWLQLTGMTQEQTRNLGWLAALHPDDLGPTVKALRETLQTGKPIDIEHRVKTIDGKWKPLRARGLPLVAPSGEIVRWYGGCEDIRESKEVEEAMQEPSI